MDELTTFDAPVADAGQDQPAPPEVSRAPADEGQDRASDQDDGAEGRSEPNPEFAAKRYVRQRDAERENSRLLQEQIRTQQQQTEALVKLVESVVGKKQAGGDSVDADVYQPRDGEDNSQYFARLIQQLVTDVNETKAERTQRLQAEEQQRQYQQFVQQVRGEYAEFAAKEAPDLQQAGEYLVEPIRKRMKALGYGDADIASEIARYEQLAIMRARQLGVSVGALIYEAAKHEGYVPEAQKKAAADAAAKRAKAEAARGIGGGGAGAAAPSAAALRAAYNKAPFGSEERARLAKQILTP